MNRSPRKTVRIGGASGFWGDSSVGAPQLVNSGLIDYLVFDYLAETTMAILAAARGRNPELGYATDFVDSAMRQVLAPALARGICIVANAGGVNPAACAAALAALAASQGLCPRIAVVEGDDVSTLMPVLRDEGVRDMFTGAPLPAEVLSANAYLGAFPVAAALAAGADIVITGRVADSAVTLGPLIHEFGWTAQDLDCLAGGSLAGHIIECGCQATGGLFTDWRDVPDWPNIGYPIVECASDGSFELFKPPDTGGLIHPACISEQLVYEIGDPAAYLLPDVTCDFRRVMVEATGGERMRVSGARGQPPTPHYKVSATERDGYRCAGMMVIVGREAAAKAHRTAEAILARTRSLLAAQGWPDYSRTRIELLGCEWLYGAHSRAQDAREVMVRIVADHPSREALELFAREIAPSGTSWSPGTTMPAGGRPAVSPLINPFSLLVAKSRIPVRVRLGETELAVSLPHEFSSKPNPHPVPDPLPWSDPAGEAQVEVPLVKLAWGRSGDKGDLSNIGIVARRAEWLPLLWDRLTCDAVQTYFSHLTRGPVSRYYLPGIRAINFLLHEALDGGGPASGRFDPLGKGNAQILLDMPIRVPRAVAAALDLGDDWRCP